MNLDAEERSKQSKILRLVDMGFSFVHAQNALISSGFDTERAIAILTSSSATASVNSPSIASATVMKAIPRGVPLDEEVERGERRPLLADLRTPAATSAPPPQWGKSYEDQRKGQPLTYVRTSMFSSHSIDPRTGEPTSRVLLFNIKLFVAVAIVVGFIVCFFAAFWIMWVYLNYPECGTSLKSARFSIEASSTYKTKGIKTGGETNDDTYSTWWRVLKGNSCPGYDWTSQSTPGVAGDDEFEFPLPLMPVNCTTPTLVGVDDPVFGHIGYTLGGVALFSPSDGSSRDAIEYEYESFDQCGGHVKAQSLLINKIFVASNPPGDYHYHAMPGDGSPFSHSSDLNLNFTICDEVSEWYTESEGQHSPLAGFMLDGIPIYGPQGADGLAPDDLDQCGGHASDLDFFHYHFKSTYPYSVDCLWGRTDGLGNGFLNNYDECVVSSVQSDYSSLVTYSTSYGGEGVNKRDTFGCLFLMSFGGALLVYGICHFLVIRFLEWRKAGYPTS